MNHSNESQERQIIEYLQSGLSLTPWQAITKFSCMRLAARIYRLKNRDGYDIKSSWMETPGGKKVKRYYL